ncbi:facilitated trehalose transporter Tret1-like [Arctopsyche grandis]|uniref:facilitated trehalose transporter Tret1-like n=1 Tax=Arctopsyche grandis TaxID=121162 RepID=UPI00406D933E
MTDVEESVEERMLSAADKSIRLVKEYSHQEKNRKESLRDFLSALGSMSSLPPQTGNFQSSSTGIVHQCVAAFAVLILSAAAGQPIGFSAVLLPQLYAENSTMNVDIELGSWIASVHSAASPVGSLVAGPLMECWGRKRTLQTCLPFLLLGWIMLASAPHLALVLIGRIVCGFGVGILAATSQVYLGEISDPKLRGMLIGAPFISYSIGILIVYLLGNIQWRWVAASGVILPLISMILFLRTPESPDWLVRHSKLSQADTAVKWLRGDDTYAKKEFHHILMANNIERNSDSSKDSFFTTIKQKHNLKPIIIINIFNLCQILSGTYFVIFYAVDIIKEVIGQSLDSLLAAIYTAVIRLVFTIVGCFLLFYMNRRSLCILSGIGSTAAAITLSIYLYVKMGTETSTFDFWIKGVCLLVYIAFNTLGFLMLPSLMVGELLPAKVRGMCGGYIFMIFNILLFAFTKAYPVMRKYAQIHGIFFIFGISSFLGTVFVYLFLPETRNKSLRQIERYFLNKNILWITRKKYEVNLTNL